MIRRRLQPRAAGMPVRLQLALVAASAVLVTVARAEGGRTAPSSGYACPLHGSPEIRPSDAVAKSGGRFDSSRDGGRKHGALDLNSTEGAPVFAAHDGVVAVSAGGWGPFGSTIIVDRGDGIYTLYAHLSDRMVEEGATVDAGQQIGAVGYTGNAAALRSAGLPPHLHFAMIRASESGLAGPGGPLRRMRNLDDSWEAVGDAQPVNPGNYMPSKCWTGSTTSGS